MQRPSVCLVVGTRPQLIKAAQLVEAHRGDDHGYDLSVVDTGQHYDANLASSVTTGLRTGRSSNRVLTIEVAWVSM